MRILNLGRSVVRTELQRWFGGHNRLEVSGSLEMSSMSHGARQRYNSRAVSILAIIVSLPLYLLPRYGKPVRVKALHELHAMAYLDALRGYLAMIIFTGHTMSRDWKWIPQSVLAIPWLQFPFRGGHASVSIFFWISGYAVTYRIVGFIQTKQTGKLHDALVSMIFRRYIRLFLPILPLVLITAIGVRAGIVLPGEQKVELVGNNPIVFWIKDTGHLLNPFCNVSPWYSGLGEGSHLVFHTWSINTEFRSSMIMLLVCIGTSKFSTAKRKLFLWLAIPAFTAWQAHYASMAFIGMWFAECRQERRQRQDSVRPIVSKDISLMTFDEKQSNAKPITLVSRCIAAVHSSPEPEGAAKLALVMLFLYSFIVLKNPYDTAKLTLFPHNYLNRMVPTYWHETMRQYMHLGIGAVMMLYPLDRLPILQRPLLTPFSQFLGELSFGIYAVHITVRWIVWEARFEQWATAQYGSNAMDRFWIAFPGWFVMAVSVLWAAELFRRFDVQVVRFCKYIETKTFEQ